MLVGAILEYINLILFAGPTWRTVLLYDYIINFRAGETWFQVMDLFHISCLIMYKSLVPRDPFPIVK